MINYKQIVNDAVQSLTFKYSIKVIKVIASYL